jgi:hypothetical protein
MNNLVTEFQVVEYFDSDKKKIWKVELQYRQVVMDRGNYMYTTSWQRVERVRVEAPELIN